MPTRDDYSSYKMYYSKEKFIKKILDFAKEAGIKVIYSGLLLYYTLQKDDLPLTIKATIIGSLGYFILPFDLVPDMIPVAGYLDDGAALATALLVAVAYIDEEVKNKARKKLKDLFSNIKNKDLIDLEKEIFSKDKK